MAIPPTNKNFIKLALAEIAKLDALKPVKYRPAIKNNSEIEIIIDPTNGIFAEWSRDPN